MGAANPRSGIDPAIARLIAIKAKQMSCQPEFREEEIADLQQKLWSHWLTAERDYDPATGSRTTFADVVLNNHILNLIQAQNAEKRAWWRCQDSLDDPIDDDDEEGLTGHDVYDPASYFTAVGQERGLTLEETELRERLLTALAGLEPRLREFALRLADHQPVTRIATAMGVHRSTLYDWQERIRRAFKDAGLEKFLWD